VPTATFAPPKFVELKRRAAVELQLARGLERLERVMARCDVCGNDYDKTIRVTQGGRSMTFDSFECAIHAMAPRCAHCDCRVVGHGIEAGDKIYCCAHCAKHEGVKGVSDRRA
jgi:nitrite reductase/ring-hydroxylating ferredoxin subunit